MTYPSVRRSSKDDRKKQKNSNKEKNMMTPAKDKTRAS